MLLAPDTVGLALLERLTFLVEVWPEVIERLGDRLAEGPLELVVPLAGVEPLDRVLVLGVQALQQELEELAHALDLDAVEEAPGAGVDRCDLVGDRPWLQLVLVEHLDQALAACQRLLRFRIEVRPELRERL